MSQEEIYRFGLNRLRSSLLQRDREITFDRELWKEVAAQNIFRIFVPENLGGCGNSLHDLVLTLKEFGRGSLDIPLGVSSIAQIIAIDLLVQFGSDGQKQKYISKLLNGEFIAAVCNSEAGAGTDIKAIKSTLSVESPSVGTLNIEKRGATNLTEADVLFCSLWRNQNEIKPSLEVVVVDKLIGAQKTHIKNLAGFKTGLTGSLSIENATVNPNEVQLGDRLAGFNILKYCFNPPAPERPNEKFMQVATLAGAVAVDYLAEKYSIKAFGDSANWTVQMLQGWSLSLALYYGVHKAQQGIDKFWPVMEKWWSATKNKSEPGDQAPKNPQKNSCQKWLENL